LIYSWLRYYTASRKAAKSIPDEVTSSSKVALGLTTSNRNEHQECSLGDKRGRRVISTNSQLSVSHLSTKCGSLEISQLYRPPWPVSEIASIFTLYIVRHRVLENGQRNPVKSTQRRFEQPLLGSVRQHRESGTDTRKELNISTIICGSEGTVLK
jgi:hypothetical protein